jgi:hypothetical protein
VYTAGTVKCTIGSRCRKLHPQIHTESTEGRIEEIRQDKDMEDSQ